MEANKRTVTFEFTTEANTEGLEKYKKEIRNLVAGIQPADQALEDLAKEILNVGASQKQTQANFNAQLAALKSLAADARAGGAASGFLASKIDTLTAAQKKATQATQELNQAQRLSQLLGQGAAATHGKSAEQVSKLREELKSLKIASSEYLAVLTRVKELEAVTAARTARQDVNASAAAYAGATLNSGFGADSNLPAMVNTMAAYRQRLAEIQPYLDNANQSTQEGRTLYAQKSTEARKLNEELRKLGESYRHVGDMAKQAGAAQAAANPQANNYLNYQAARRDRAGAQFRDQVTANAAALPLALPAAGGSSFVGSRDAAGRGGGARPDLLGVGSLYAGPTFGTNAGSSASDAQLARQAAAADRARTSLSGHIAEMQRARLAGDRSVQSLERQTRAWTNLRNAVDPASPTFRRANRELTALNQRLDTLTPERRGGGNQFALGQTAGAIVGSSIYGGPLGFAGAAIGGVLGGPGGALLGGGVGAQAGMTVGALGGTATYAADIAKLQIGLKDIVKTQAEYEFSIAAINRVTQDFNIQQLEATRGFTQLSAAVIGAGGNARDAEVAYRAVVSAIKAAGGSAQDADGALRAITQSFSKGKVSAEELRGQLGERLPGAFEKFAKSAGMSGQELDKALEDGRVGLNDLMKFLVDLGEQSEGTARKIASSQEDAGARAAVAYAELRNELGKILGPLGAEFQQLSIEGVKALTEIAKESKPLVQLIVNLVRGTDDLISGIRRLDGVVSEFTKKAIPGLGGVLTLYEKLNGGDARGDIAQRALFALPGFGPIAGGLASPFFNLGDKGSSGLTLRSSLSDYPSGYKPTKFDDPASDDAAKKKAAKEAEKAAKDAAAAAEKYAREQARYQQQLVDEQRKLNESIAMQRIDLADKVFAHQKRLIAEERDLLQDLDNQRLRNILGARPDLGSAGGAIIDAMGEIQGIRSRSRRLADDRDIAQQTLMGERARAQVSEQYADPLPVAPTAPGSGAAGSVRGSGVGAAVAAAQGAGFSGRLIPLMAAIAMAESSGRPDALNNNPATGDRSYGLWQINMLGGMGPERRRQFGISSNEALFDPATNARAAKAIYDSQGLNAWSVYRSGAYRQYLPAAAAAMQRGGGVPPAAVLPAATGSAMGLQVGQAVPYGAAPAGGGAVPGQIQQLRVQAYQGGVAGAAADLAGVNASLGLAKEIEPQAITEARIKASNRILESSRLQNTELEREITLTQLRNRLSMEGVSDAGIQLEERRNEVTYEYRKSIESLTLLQEALGERTAENADVWDLTASSIKALNAELPVALQNMQALYDLQNAPGAKIGQRMGDLTREINEMQNTENQIVQFSRSIEGSLSSAIGNAVTDFARGTGDIRQIAASFLSDLAGQFAAFGSELLSKQLMRGLLGLFGGGLTGGGGGGLPGFSMAGSFFAGGGIMTPRGPMPLKAYANGGVANSPQVAVFGEGRQNEAFVPLPDGRRIPVELRIPYARSGSGGGGSAEEQALAGSGSTRSTASAGQVFAGPRAMRMGAPGVRGAAGRAGADGASLSVPYLMGGGDAGPVVPYTRSAETILAEAAARSAAAAPMEPVVVRVEAVDPARSGLVTVGQLQASSQAAVAQAQAQLLDRLQNSPQSRRKIRI